MDQFLYLPLATCSAVAFYLLLLSLVFPPVRSAVHRCLFASANENHLMGFDTIRGLAMLSIALGHGFWFDQPAFNSTAIMWPWLQYTAKGVGIFCVLSGFLIYRSLLQIRTVADVGKYFVRRFFRIYPVYFIGILLGLLFSQYSNGSGSGIDFSYLLSDLFMVTTFAPAAKYANPVCWSLYGEVLFYLALPPVMFFFRKRMLIFSTIALAALVVFDNPSRVIGLWRYFLIGIMASELSRESQNRAVNYLLMFSGLTMILVDFRGPAFDWASQIGWGCVHPALDTLGSGIGTGLILTALPHLSGPGKILDFMPLRLLGTISYSVFIGHMFFILANFPCIGLANKPLLAMSAKLPPGGYSPWFLPGVMVPGMLFWGLVCFLLIEYPGMQLGRRLCKGNRSSQSIAGGLPAHAAVPELQALSTGVR